MTTVFVVMTNRRNTEPIAVCSSADAAQAYLDAADIWDNDGKVSLYYVEVPLNQTTSPTGGDWSDRYRAADRLLDGIGDEMDTHAVLQFLGSDADLTERSRLAFYWMLRTDNVANEKAKRFVDGFITRANYEIVVGEGGVVLLGGQPILIHNKLGEKRCHHLSRTYNAKADDYLCDQCKEGLPLDDETENFDKEIDESIPFTLIRPIERPKSHKYTVKIDHNDGNGTQSHRLRVMTAEEAMRLSVVKAAECGWTIISTIDDIEASKDK